MRASVSADDFLPDDGCAGVLVGRAWATGATPGPAVVAIRPDGVYDIGRRVPTVAALLDAEDPVALVRGADGSRLSPLDEILDNTPEDRRDPHRPWFLAPADLQAIKACGVTFVKSMLERVIEEQARGDPAQADDIRRAVAAEVGGDLKAVVPGSEAAARLKQALIERGMWSQYLEVGIGPHAEVFTKCQPMSAVGACADIGLHPESTWNNPEPEIVLVVNPRGVLVGATLGNDTNLRDFEGLSALLLGKAKDNNGSCALGPFIRLIDESYTLDDIRQAEVRVEVQGDDGFALDEVSSMRDITERRRLERLQAEFVSTVSHELRTPLASILGFSETLLGGSPGPLTQLQREFLEISHESGKRLLRLIDDLLDIGRLENGRLMLQAE